MVEEKYYHYPHKCKADKYIELIGKQEEKGFTAFSRSRLALKICIFKFRNRTAEEKDTLLEINIQFWAVRQDVKADRGCSSRD